MDTQKRRRYTLGTGDIPWWTALVAIAALMYLSSTLPSELQPLPILDTIPAAGARNAPLDTVLQIRFETGGFRKVFGEATPLIRATYNEESGVEEIPARVVSQGDTLRAVLEKPLRPGRQVKVLVRTRFGRDLVWTFYSTDDLQGPTATPLPPFCGEAP